MRRWLQRGAVAALVLTPRLSTARAEALRVQIQTPSSEDAETTSRLAAELRSEGYELAWREALGWPCGAPRSAPLRSERAAFIEVERSREPPELVARICYSDGAGALEQAAVRAPAAEPWRLALAAVEALNGLRAEPQAVRDTQRVIAPLALPSPQARTSSVFADAAIALDAVGGLPVIGVDAGLESEVTEHLSLEVQAFVPAREGDTRGVERELSLSIAWFRAGARWSWERAPLRFGVSLQGGPALVWASAQSESAERAGTTATRTTGMLSSGVSLECPSASTVFFRAGGRVSRLLPKVELALGDGSHQPFGELLIDLNLGVGVRWGG